MDSLHLMKMVEHLNTAHILDREGAEYGEVWEYICTQVISTVAMTNKRGICLSLFSTFLYLNDH